MMRVSAYSALAGMALVVMTGCSSTGSAPVPQATTVVWATPAPVGVGATLTSAQLDATAVITGTSTPILGAFVYTPSIGTTLNSAGSQTLSVTFYPTDIVHYSTSSATVTLSVNPLPTPSYSYNSVQIVGGGYVTGVLFHPAQQGLAYARTDVGGAYRYDSSPGMWTPLTDWVTRANSNLIGIESIGIDPSNPQLLYLAAGTYADSYGSNGAMLLSSDQGHTFRTVNMPIKMGSNDNGRNAGERLSVDPNLGSVIYFGSRNNGLWNSRDSGATWNQVASFPVTGTTSGVGVVFETYIPSSSSAGSATKTIYAGVSATGTGSDPQCLYVSNDAGATWAAVPGAPTGFYISHGVLGPDGNLYMTFGNQVGPGGLTGGAVYQYVVPTQSNPNGAWNNISPPRPSGDQGGYGAVTLDPEAPGTLMVSTLDHYYPVGDDLWRSTNYGQSWYSINTVGAIRDASLSPWLYFGASTITNTGNWVGSMQIDPFNSNHVIYGDGQTVWATEDMTVSDSGQPSNWAVGALGIEETVVTDLISPPAGPADLLSTVGDLGGFQHTTLTASPAAGAFSNPAFSTGSSIDVAWANPTVMARVGNGSAPFGGYSTDYGTTWAPFGSTPSGTQTGAGNIAVAADGSVFVWTPSDGGTLPSYSANNGGTWTSCAGLTSGQAVVADRVNPLVFYAFNQSASEVYTSINGGQTFTASLSTGIGYGQLVASPAAQGDLWIASGGGLYHSTGGAAFTQDTSVQSAWGIAFGAPAMGSATLTIYLGGQVGGTQGVFRSSDYGNTWVRIDDSQHEYGYLNVIQADPRIFGRVYLGTGGRGIIYGDSAE